MNIKKKKTASRFTAYIKQKILKDTDVRAKCSSAFVYYRIVRDKKKKMYKRNKCMYITKFIVLLCIIRLSQTVSWQLR